MSLIDLGPLTPARGLGHISSHRSLVEMPRLPARSAGPPLDAVIVPATRPVATLHHAAAVAQRAGCPLLLLCSQGITATDAVAAVSGSRRSPRVVAVDVQGDYGRLDVKLRTDTVGPAPHGRGDASHKRNVGLLVARMRGWRTVLFLDDDVFGLDERALAEARAMLAGETPGGPVEAVGWSFDAYADNSVVCHAYRGSGGSQDTFIGGGGLAVRVHAETAFFPSLYNEDWLFLFDLVAQARVLRAGGLCQLPYDPFDDAARAEYQEFGDLFAESLFALLHLAQRPVRGRDVELLLEPAFSAEWWLDRIRRRQEFIASIDGTCRSRGISEDSPVRRSLRSAFRTLDPGWARDLVDFAVAWRDDVATWRGLMAGTGHTTLERALDLLDLEGVGDSLTLTDRGVGGSRAPSRP